MKKTTHLERVDYIPPEAYIIPIKCQDIFCKSGEVPDMNEGWRYDF